MKQEGRVNIQCLGLEPQGNAASLQAYTVGQTRLLLGITAKSGHARDLMNNTRRSSGSFEASGSKQSINAWCQNQQLKQQCLTCFGLASLETAYQTGDRWEKVRGEVLNENGLLWSIRSNHLTFYL